MINSKEGLSLKMSSSVTLRLNEPCRVFHEFVITICERRKVKITADFPVTEYNIHIYKQDWYVWKRAILKHAKLLLPHLSVEFDRSGDEEDERLIIIWNGDDFIFEYWCSVD